MPSGKPPLVHSRDVLGVAGLLLSLLLLLGALWLELRNSRELLESALLVDHTHEVLDELTDATSHVIEAHAARRAFALTGDLRDRDEAEDRMAAAERDIDAIRELTRDNPRQQHRVDELADLFAARAERLRDALRESEGRPIDIGRERAITREGAEGLRTVRAVVASMHDEEQRLLFEREAAEIATSAKVRKTIVGATGTSVVLIVVAFGLLRTELSRRTAAEAAARASEQRVRRIVAATPDAILIVDASGRITLVNDRATDVFGYTREELEGRSVEDLVPEDLRRAHEVHREAYAAAPSTRPMGTPTMTLLGVRQDGSRFPAEISLSPLSDASGRLAIAAVRDVTRQKEDEAALKHAKEAAEAANAELESFAYSVAHDLRSPLRSIDGFSQALLEDYEAKLDDDGRDALRRVRGAAKRMGQLIDDLLALSRVTRTEIRRETVDVTTMAEQIVARLRDAEPARKVAVEVEPGLVASADPRLLSVALENLIGNAWKFTSRKPAAHIAIGARDVQGKRTFFVRDDGAGFDMAYAGKLFVPFQRLHRNDEFAGTGIGLATVHRVVRRHGGRISAEAKPDEGATFTFTLS